MKALILGASGFVGGYMVRAFAQAGWEVYGTGSSRAAPGLLRFDLSRDRIGDVLPGAFRDTGGASCAVICTTAPSMDLNAMELERMRQTHVTGTIRLSDDLAEMGIRIVFLSTSYVFDGRLGYYDETDAPCPISEYGRQKLALEAHLTRHHPSSLVFRLEKMVSGEAVPRNVLSEWLRQMRAGETIRCIAGQIFAPTLVGDVACAVRLGCEKGLRGLYHVANCEFFPREELAFQLARAAGLEAKIVSLPVGDFGFADPRPLKTYLNCTKFTEATGMRFTSMRRVFADLLRRA